VEVVILAAGKGTRMNTDKPKVLHSVGGKAMIEHVLTCAAECQPERTHVVIGYGGEELQSYLGARSDINWVTQEQQLGTGHAVQQALPAVDTNDSENQLLVLFGDVPMISATTLKALLSEAGSDSLALLTVVTEKPDGFGRIVRDEVSAVQAIVEHKDATAEQLLINEVNTGIMVIPASRLTGWLDRIQNNNKQQEYYLTDIVSLAVDDGCPVKATQATSEMEVLGVNDKTQLAILERYYQTMQAEDLLAAGVTLRDPSRLDVRGTLSCGKDVEIDSNVLFEGDVTLGDAVVIGANCVIKNATIGAGSQVLPGTQIEGAEIGAAVSIGPMARIRPGTIIRDKAKIGNFVETKQALIGEGSKANHLAYIGDAELGSGCNIGAGTIFCNYDGANKHKTTLGDNVFVGSNSVLIAPVTLADNAFVAAGSAINTDVPAEHLGVARGKQRNIAGWKRPIKKSK